jgi:phosphoglycolate phosphatase
MICAVIFDLDGTLIHSLPGLTTSLNRVLKTNGLPTHSESTVRGFIGNGIKTLIDRAVPKNLNPSLKNSILQEMSHDYATHWKTGSSPYPGISETLQRLSEKGIILAVFSNKPDRFCREMTDHLLPDIPFIEVLGQKKGTPVKPDPSGALIIANSLNIPPQDIAFLGDSTIDIATAHNAGMLSIAATWGYHDLPALKAEHPAHLIHHIEDLLPIIDTTTS